MRLRCISCDAHVEEPLAYQCPSCGGILDPEIAIERFDPERFRTVPETIWHYREVFDVREPVSLGEGGTPLIQSGVDVGVDQVFLKAEGLNPTCSFKDRPNAVGLATVAERTDVERAVISSHGNAGASFASYANRVGIEPIVLVPEGASAGLPKVRAYQAITVPVAGDISDTYRLAQEAAASFGWYNGTTTHQVPIANQGNRTMAYELFAQLGGVPDYVVIPISAGPLLTQTYRGFEELRELGLVDRLPGMIGTQAAGCAPIARAFERGEERVAEWREPMETIATSIEDPLRGYPEDGTYTLSVIRESGGAAVACSDEKTRAATQRLARTDGMLAEYASATTIPAIEQLKREGFIASSDQVVAVITGHGMNETDKLAKDARTRERIPVDVDALADVV